MIYHDIQYGFVGDISIVNGVHKPTFTLPGCAAPCKDGHGVSSNALRARSSRARLGLSCGSSASEYFIGTRPTDVLMDGAGENDEKIGQAKVLWPWLSVVTGDFNGIIHSMNRLMRCYEYTIV